MTTADQFARAKYVSLTTYRKDGTPVATPVWLAVDGGELFVISDSDAWKVKRVRRTSRVTVAACDVRGRVAPDAVPVEGTARVLDDTGSQRVRQLIARKYWMSRVGNWAARVLHLPKKPVVGIAVTF
ncbi:PPOX class F420-dependent oxidoreductase [Catellatospora coxensis]|uniref:PPOX class F420-dependent oxidoreductase n=1 Tax=Catellatospora coxensis TaxID=310354 RepID=UPI001940CCDE|nr:PPOX class F420-dependent oxidoreductase [Catellatospora coxensis]